MTSKTLRLIFQIILSVCLAVTGVLLMVSCWKIYISGDRPFSPESVAAAFISIRIPVFITLALAVLGLVLDVIFPAETKKLQPEKQYGVILQRLTRKLDPASCGADLQKAIAHQRTKRRIVHIAFFAVTIICCGIFLGYAVQPTHFDDMQINQSIVKAMLWFFPCLAVPFGFGLFDHYFSQCSIRKEIDLVRQALAGSTAAAAAEAAASPVKFPVAKLIRWGILLIAVGSLIYGLLTGGTNDVLTKAVNICTECVGLG